VSAAPVAETTSRTFVIVLFAVAVIVGVAITYLGIAGVIGGPIP